jgi:hypothetical protein
MNKFIKKIVIGLILAIMVGGMPTNAGVQDRTQNFLKIGNFEQGTTGWTASGGYATLSVVAKAPNADGSDNSAMRVSPTNPAGGAFVSQTGLVSGVDYLFEGWCRGDGTNIPIFASYQFDQYLVGCTNSTSWQRFKMVRRPLYIASAPFGITTNTGAGWAEFDNISVTRYYGTVQSRDTNLVADGNMEKSDTSAWTSFNVTSTKVAGASDVAGTQVLRVERTGSSGVAYQVNTFVNGYTYRVKGRARSVDGEAVPIVYNTYGLVWANGTNSTSWQDIDVIYTATNSGNLQLYPGATNGVIAEFDNISVTRYHGDVKNVERNLLDNGNFELGTTGFTSVGAGSVSSVLTPATGQDGSKALRLTKSGAGVAFIITPLPFPGGGLHTYRMTGWARGDGTSYPAFTFNGGATIPFSGTSSNTWQRIDVLFTPPVTSGGQILLYGFNGNATNYVEFDNLSLVAIDKEPNYANDGNMELTGTAFWPAALGSPTITKETGTYDGSGTKVLRIVGTGTAGFYTTSSLIQSKLFRARGCVRGDGVAIPRIAFANSTVLVMSASTAWQCFDIQGTPTASALLYIGSSSATGTLEFDNVIITAVY